MCKPSMNASGGRGIASCVKLDELIGDGRGSENAQFSKKQSDVARGTVITELTPAPQLLGAIALERHLLLGHGKVVLRQREHPRELVALGRDINRLPEGIRNQRCAR